MTDLDYGPLTGLIGIWKGNKGEDLAPIPDGIEQNNYYETITYSAAGDLDNAETQELIAVQYRQCVNRISDDKAIHDQTGYWIWDAEAEMIMHSFTIPRGVAVLAGGSCLAVPDGENLLMEVKASQGGSDWQIIQSPFMQGNAVTREFEQQLVLGKDSLRYSQMTTVEIYGQIFEHSDGNELLRQ
jgi:hypothetical protein